MKRAIAVLAVTGAALAALLPSQVSADPASHFTERVRRRVFNPCTGEDVLIKGRNRVVFKVTRSQDENLFHFVAHSTLNLIAVGVDSGTEYRAIQVETFTGTAAIAGDSLIEVVTAQAVLHLIAQGSTDDFFLPFRLHITVTPSGEVVSVVLERGDVVCTG